MTAQPGNFYKNSNMKLLLNDKEIAKFLIALVNVRDSCADIEMNERHTADQIHWVIETRDKPKFNLEKHRDKIKQKINGLYIFVIFGSVQVNGVQLETRDGLGVWDTENFTFEVKTDKTKILLMDVPMR